MAQHLFSEVVFNLDTRRIESFVLKPWTDDFVMLRWNCTTRNSETWNQAAKVMKKPWKKRIPTSF